VQHLPRARAHACGVCGGGPVDVETLVRLIDEDVTEGVTELICHPAHPDPHVPVNDHDERELELRTLCDPSIRRALWSQGIRLASYNDLARVGLVREIAWHA
jgi:predicted glycoside hydrolase/deacetylase ChbG (UPF0249 family)